MDTHEYALVIVEELRQVLSAVDAETCERLASAILGAGKVLVAGAGRSGLAARAFAMRLMHMGFDAYVVGETVTPNLEPGDLFLVASGSGETGSLVVMSDKARRIGATLATVTVNPEGTVAKRSDIVVCIPAPTPKAPGARGLRSVQPMGSLFEQALLLVLDAVILRLMERKGLDSDTMFTRHANLE